MFPKKIVLLCALIFLMTGCTVKDDLDDDIYNTTNNTTKNTTSNTGSTNTTNNATDINESSLPQGLPDENKNLSSIQGIYDNLDTTLTEMARNGDVTDPDYLTNERDYYTNMSAAYKKAYDDFSALGLTGNEYNAIGEYYKGGYDTYRNLSTKYGSFKDIDEETAYRTGTGKTSYEMKQNLTDAYEGALDRIGVNYNSSKKSTTTKR